ncbi:hypothetical protein L9F63_017737, partial [Diploptera punctata]
LLVHKRRAKKFYSKMENVKNICKERNDVMAIALDRIYSPNQYDDIIRNARKLNPPYEYFKKT